MSSSDMKYKWCLHQISKRDIRWFNHNFPQYRLKGHRNGYHLEVLENLPAGSTPLAIKISNSQLRLSEYSQVVESTLKEILRPITRDYEVRNMQASTDGKHIYFMLWRKFSYQKTYVQVPYTEQEQAV